MIIRAIGLVGVMHTRRTSIEKEYNAGWVDRGKKYI